MAKIGFRIVIISLWLIACGIVALASIFGSKLFLAFVPVLIGMGLIIIDEF